MHPQSKLELAEHLRFMQEHGTTMSMLCMTVKSTSDGMIAGVVMDGSLRLDYARAGWLDFIRLRRFLSFCRRNDLGVIKELWGKEHIYRAAIGSDASKATDTIAECFQYVFGHPGPYALELRPFGWQPSNSSLKPKPLRGSA